MENLNKIISLIIGLVIVVVFFGIVSGRINIRNLTKVGTRISPTVTTKPTAGPTGSLRKITPTLSYQVNQYQTDSGVSPTTIPSTGQTAILLPTLLSTLLAGIFLRKRK